MTVRSLYLSKPQHAVFAAMPEVVATRTAIECATSYEERPLFFRYASQALYGVFYAPSSLGRQDRVLVFCHGLGIEHMVTQRMEVLGARAAAASGFAAFRYNARAHGDSAGDAKDVTFSDLVEDACAAADHARELSGAATVIWVGVRFGCLIAAEAMARRGDAAAVALWEPLHGGEDYFRAAIRTTLFCQVAQGKRSNSTIDDMVKQLEADGALPVVGTYLYRTLWRSTRDADLARTLRVWAGDTLLAQVQSRRTLSANNENLRSAIEQRGGKVATVLINPEPTWSMLPVVRPQWTSETLLAATREWLHGVE
jgi:pimeloyl-ACP methyl ester carboxylesterase